MTKCLADLLLRIVATGQLARVQEQHKRRLRSGTCLVQQPPRVHETIADQVELPEATHVRVVLVIAARTDDLQRAGQRRQPCVSIEL